MTSVLIVDNHERMRRLLRAVVDTVADVVLECSDGQEAVVIYQVQHPDYVLIDIDMKGGDGIQATRQILKLDPGARVIIVTQHGDPAWRAAASAAGAHGYVLKDDLKTLRRLIQAEHHPRSSTKDSGGT